jgi:hypothetical protein
MIVGVPCLCPEKDGNVRHPDGDTLTFVDRLDFRRAKGIRDSMGIAALVEPDQTLAATLAYAAEGYLLFGLEAWTLERDNEKGRPEPIPLTQSAIRSYLLSNVEAATIAYDAVDDAYASAVILPLLNGASPSSLDTPTGRSTSPKAGGSGRRPRQSKRSSITTIPTAGTETTSSSLAGDSSFSPSSTSAA